MAGRGWGRIRPSQRLQVGPLQAVTTTTSFWQYVLAILKSLVWPALLAYDALRSLKG
jgi:hypothetical protein